MKNRIIKLSKLEIAKTELEEAIRLFMLSRNIIVVHLVASSAQIVLRDLCRHNNILSPSDELANTIKEVLPHKNKYFINKLHEAHNFMKHAEKDPDAILEFNPESTEFVIFEAIGLYSQLVEELTGLMDAYRIWFCHEHADIMDSEKVKPFLEALEEVDMSDKTLILKAGEAFETRKIKKR